MNPPNQNRAGVAAFNTIVSLVMNRTGWGRDFTFNQTARRAGDLLRAPALPHGVDSFHKVLNRAQAATGWPTGANIDLLAAQVARITNRFAPNLSSQPTALQWQVLWATALQLERAGIPARLYNRRANDPEVSASDWKKANACAGYVFSLLADQTANPVDRGTLAEFSAPEIYPAKVRATFRSAVNRLMADGGLTLQKAFDKLKEDEPIFWTMAMLSFEPEK